MFTQEEIDEGWTLSKPYGHIWETWINSDTLSAIYRYARNELTPSGTYHNTMVQSYCVHAPLRFFSLSKNAKLHLRFNWHKDAIHFKEIIEKKFSQSHSPCWDQLILLNCDERKLTSFFALLDKTEEFYPPAINPMTDCVREEFINFARKNVQRKYIELNYQTKSEAAKIKISPQITKSSSSFWRPKKQDDRVKLPIFHQEKSRKFKKQGL